MGLFTKALSRVGEFRDISLKMNPAMDYNGETVEQPDPAVSVLAGHIPDGYDTWEHAAKDYMMSKINVNFAPGGTPEVTHLSPEPDWKELYCERWTRLRKQIYQLFGERLSVNGVHRES